MDSPRLRILTGAEIVDRGRNVTDTQLPEVGTKDTTATGSWLEQKQVQAALEARKALVSVERIDKVGCLSHAEWLDEEKLAEVTQQIGGYWQYMGHKVNGVLYLLPEEALYLMETNCLLLKHNNVTVSLQKAYSLLLDDEMTLTQYKVYASLSRVGYKVFRHDRLKISPVNESNRTDALIDLQQDNNAMEVSTDILGEAISCSNMASASPKNPAINSNLVPMATDAVMQTDDNKPEVARSVSTMSLELPKSNVMETCDTAFKDSSVENKTNDVTALSTEKPPESTNISNEAILDINSPLKTSIENPAIQSLMAADPSIPTEDKIITENKAIKSLSAMATDVVMNPVMLKDDEIDTAKLSSTMPLEQPKSNAMDLSELKDIPSIGIINEVPVLSTNKPNSPSEKIYSIDENGVVRLGLKDTDMAMETDTNPVTHDQTPNENKMETDADVNENSKSSNKDVRLNSYIVKKLKIQNRNIQCSDPKSMHENFKDMPDFYKQEIVTVNVPCEDYLPRNVFLNNTSYVVNTNNFSNKPAGRCLTPIRPAGNRAMYKTIRNSIESENAAVPTPETSQFVPNTPSYERPYGYYPNWRPHFQRPFYQQPRFNQHPYFYRMMNSMPQNVTYATHIPRQPFNLNHIQRQKVKDDHLDAIKNLARSLNHVSPNNYHNLKFSINGLLGRFNKIYGEKFIITPKHYIINTKQRIETIEIQDDEVGDKQHKVNKFDQYLGSIKMLAARLKNLKRKKQPIAKQKRAFSKLVKHFNKEYDAELYLDDDGELVDRKLVVLDSSDSDVTAVDEITTNRKKRKSRDGNGTTNKKRKILANPFSVIAKLNGSTSQNVSEIPQVPSQGIEKHFDKNWLPGDDDFGKAVPCSITDAQHLLYDTQQLYEFMEDPNSFKTWVDLKLTFYTHMEAVSSFEQDLTESRNLTQHSGLKPILLGAVAENWASSDKLRIIKTNTDIEETSLCIHFDVYNRDVQNFRKTDPPTPHFRIVCINESSRFPSTAEVKGLYSKYNDNVNITFAIVGIASISYLQMKPTDLPIVGGDD